MGRIVQLAVTVVALLLFTSFAHAQPAQQGTPAEFQTQTDPISLVGAYYNAISRGEYARAYSYWESAPQGRTEAEFQQGFADTLNARAFVRLPVFEDAGAGNVYASLPTMVVVHRTDGSTAYFAGCFVAHKTNVPVGNATQPDPNWYLRDGTLSEQATPDFAALDTACDPNSTFTLATNPAPSNLLEPANLLQSYFTALRLGEGALAEAYWRAGTIDTFGGQYLLLFSASPSMNVYVDPVYFSDAGAGNIFAAITALAVANDANNQLHFVVGCFTVHKSNVPVGNATEPDPNWLLERVNSVEASNVTDTLWVLNALAPFCPPQ